MDQERHRMKEPENPHNHGCDRNDEYQQKAVVAINER